MISGVSAFLWQAALMLLGAYFLGTFLGCWLRRRVNAPPKVAMESRADETGGTRSPTPAAVASPDRFGRALEGGDRPAPHPASAPVAAPPKAAEAEPRSSQPMEDAEDGNLPVGALDDAAAHASPTSGAAAGPTSIAPPAPLAKIPPEEPPIKPPAPTTRPAAQIPPEEPPPTPIAPAATPTNAALTPPMSAAAAAAAARAARLAVSNRPAAATASPQPTTDPNAPTATIAGKLEQLDPPARTDLPAASGSVGQATVAAPIETSTAPAANDPADLTLIKGVTDADAAVLQEAGVTTFAAIASWTAADVARVSASITDQRRISRENWIEQAQLLQNGGSTAHTRGVMADLAPRPAEIVPAVPGIAVAAAALSIASERHDDEADLQGAPAPPEDAVSDVESGEPAALAEPVAAVVEAAPPVVSERAAFARERRGYADDLQQIDGINPEVEKLLNEQGVTRVAQIAGWPTAEAQRIDRLLGGMNRVRRENWVGQARRISGFSESDATDGHDTAPVPDNAPDATGPDEGHGEKIASAVTGPDDASTGEPASTGKPDDATPTPENNVVALGSSTPAVARNNVSHLRSVRSEALVGPSTAPPDTAGDDLKRIRGIGVLIEKRLRSMGYSSYEQIGSWTQADVDRVNQKLDFRGRIERENWIEQARILAAGGQTEFSRRQERNDD